jgi:hypothetical protein
MAQRHTIETQENLSAHTNITWIKDARRIHHLLESIQGKPYGVEVGFGHRPLYGPHINPNMPWFHFECDEGEFKFAQDFVPEVSKDVNLNIPLHPIYFIQDTIPWDFMNNASVIAVNNIDYRDMYAPSRNQLKRNQRLIAVFTASETFERFSATDLDLHNSINFWLELGYSDPIYQVRPSHLPQYSPFNLGEIERVMDVIGR